MPAFFMHIGKTAGSAVNQMLAAHFGDRFIDHIEAKPGWWDRLDDYDCLSGHFYFENFRKTVGGRPFRYFTAMREPVAQFRSHLNWIRVLGEVPTMRKNTDPRVLALSDELAKLDTNNPDQMRRFIERDGDGDRRMILFDNCQSRYFLAGPRYQRMDRDAFKQVLTNMAKFDFVGISENTGGLVGGIWRTLGVESNVVTLPYANVQKYDRNGDTEAWRMALGEWIAYDCALYELARHPSSELEPYTALWG